MSVLEENLKILQEKYPVFYQQMHDGQPEEQKKWNIKFMDTRDDMQALIVDTEEEEVRLNSNYRPKKEAERWVSQYEFSHRQINVIIFGLGNGLFVREILNRMGSDARCFIYEPDFTIFRKVIQGQDMTDILNHDQVKLTFGTEKSLFMELLQPYVNWATVSHQIVTVHPGYEKLYPKEEQEYWYMIKKMEATAKITSNTNVFFLPSAVENALRNVHYVKDSNYMNEFDHRFDESVPAIIVSAGPSLDKNIDDIKKAKGKAVIIATDTAVRHLEKHGVYYDCMVTLDTKKPAEYFLDAPKCKEKPLFCSISANPSMLDFHIGRKIWYSNELILSILYKRYGLEMTKPLAGGSVATVATVIARRMGIKNVILAGQDLAYGEHGTHAGGAFVKSRIEEKERFVEGVDGTQVKTRSDWLYYLEWFEEQAKSRDFHLIDATEGGAKIHGSEIMTLSGAIDKYCNTDVDFAGILREIPPTFSIEQYQKVKKDIIHIDKEMNYIIEYTAKGMKYCQEYLQKEERISEKRKEEYRKEIKKINQCIMNQEIASDLLDAYTSALTKEELANITTVTGDDRKDNLASVNTALIVYKAYHDGALKLLKILRESLQNL